jgi:hypothetical protein
MKLKEGPAYGERVMRMEEEWHGCVALPQADEGLPTHPGEVEHASACM